MIIDLGATEEFFQSVSSSKAAGVGKTYYMSPQRLSSVKYDAPSDDMWALGLIALEVGLRQRVHALFPPISDPKSDANAPANRRHDLDAQVARCPEPWRTLAQGLLLHDYKDRWTAQRTVEEVEKALLEIV